MNPGTEKYQKLIELIYDKTVGGQINWQIGSNQNLSVEIGSNTLAMRESQNSDGEDLYIFELLRENGSLSDKFNDESLVISGEKPKKFDSWFSLCRAIYAIAMRKATGADDVLDAMIQDLDDMIPF